MSRSKPTGCSRLLTLLALAGALLTAGCIEMAVDLNLRSNGAAVIKAEWAIADSAVDQIQALIRLQRQLALLQASNAPAIDMDSIIMQVLVPDEERLTRLVAQQQPYGVHAEQIVVEARNLRRQVSLRLAIDDLAKFAECELFARYGFQLVRQLNGDYRFTRLAVAPVAPTAIPAMSTVDKQQLLAPLLKGMTVQFTLATPGRIKESNATRQQAVHAKWIFRFDEDPDVLLTMQNQDMHVVFDGIEATLPDVSGGRRAPAAAP